MRTTIVLTLTGPDRVGIVEQVTGLLLELDSNIETSRMMRLGGEFAILALATLPTDKLPALDAALEPMTSAGYKMTVTPTEQAAYPGWLAYQVEVEGADHEGIIHEIARGLSQQGISVESMETGTTRAPITGTPLFTMTALVLVPPGLAEDDWTSAVIEASQQSNVDVTVVAVGDR